MKKLAKICILILLILILTIAALGLFVRFGSSAVPFEGKDWVIEESEQDSFESVLFLDDCQWSHYSLKNGVDSLQDTFTRYRYFSKQKKVLVYDETKPYHFDIYEIGSYDDVHLHMKMDGADKTFTAYAAPSVEHAEPIRLGKTYTDKIRITDRQIPQRYSGSFELSEYDGLYRNAYSFDVDRKCKIKVWIDGDISFDEGALVDEHMNTLFQFGPDEFSASMDVEEPEDYEGFWFKETVEPGKYYLYLEELVTKDTGGDYSIRIE